MARYDKNFKLICLEAYEKSFVILRTLSDKADSEGHDSYENFADEVAEQLNRIVLKMFETIE